MIAVPNLHNFFDELPAQVRAEFDRVSHYRQEKAGTVLVHRGDMRGTLSQIVDGEAKVSSFDSRGRETVAATLKTGDWFGLSEALIGIPSMVDTIAITPARLRIVARRDFDALLERHPIIARQLLRLFCHRFAIVYRTAQDRHELPLSERLLKMLYLLSFEHAARHDGGDAAELRMAQDELAKMLAVSRQTLNRELRSLERGGLLTLGYRSIRLAPRARLLARYPHLFGMPDGNEN